MYHDLFPSSLASVELANVPFPNATVPPDEELYPDVSSDIIPHIPIDMTVAHIVLSKEH